MRRPAPHRTRGKAPSTSRAPIDPHRVNRCAELLAKGATVLEERLGGMLALSLNGRTEMVTERRTLIAARKVIQNGETML